MAFLTLLDVAKLNGTDKEVGLIEENLIYAPEMTIFPVRTIKGTQYDTTVRTSWPNVGFRRANEGHTPGKSLFDRRKVECFIFGGVIQADKAIGLASEDGLAAFEMMEASGVVKQSMVTLGSQIWNGVSADPKGFAGIKSLTPFGGTLVYNAAGTTATTASSVYGVKFGIQDVIMPIGEGGKMELSEFRDQQITLDSGTTWLPGRVSDMTSWIGLQVGNVNCIGRICNLTADSGKTLTDAKIEAWLAQFPVGYVPDYVFMSRRSRSQLQLSRTVILNGGATGKVTGDMGNVAPLPTFTAGGIPIITTDSIGITDAIEA